jgi:hypothetical protein
MEIKFEVYPGSKGEKKYSRRYGALDDDAPIRDIYIMRPFCEGEDKITIEIKE